MTTPITTTLRALTADTETLLARSLRPFGITVPQLEFLAEFAATPGSCGADAAKACHVTPQTGTAVMRGLTRRGLVKAKHIPGNGRRHTVTVTPTGHATLAAVRDATRSVEELLDALLGARGVELLQTSSDALGVEVASRPVPKPRSTATGAKKAPKKSLKKVPKASVPKPDYVLTTG